MRSAFVIIAQNFYRQSQSVQRSNETPSAAGDLNLGVSAYGGCMPISACLKLLKLHFIELELKKSTMRNKKRRLCLWSPALAVLAMLAAGN